ncbi:MAG: hypothetical protein ACKOAT_13430, partial [Actinomycetota bacterium]
MTALLVVEATTLPPAAASTMATATAIRLAVFEVNLDESDMLLYYHTSEQGWQIDATGWRVLLLVP